MAGGGAVHTAVTVAPFARALRVGRAAALVDGTAAEGVAIDALDGSAVAGGRTVASAEAIPAGVHYEGQVYRAVRSWYVGNDVGDARGQPEVSPSLFGRGPWSGVREYVTRGAVC